MLKPSSQVPLVLPDNQAPTRSPKWEDSVLARKPRGKHTQKKANGRQLDSKGAGRGDEDPLPSNRGC